MPIDKIASLIKQKKRLINSTLKSIENNTLKKIEGKKSKLYIGQLSTGCIRCINGDITGIYLTNMCTRKCFFCPQDRNLNYDYIPHLQEGLRFYTIKDSIDYLKKFKFTGVGFSGGEPLLAFDKLITYIKGIRKNIGKSMYIWIYTNGDLATEERLKKLKEAGLDEIRFDLAARNYDLTPVKLAKKYINKVTIETPVIPEDYKILLKSLKEMEKIGVDYLNLHKLQTNKFNKEAFEKRGYVFNEESGSKDGISFSYVADSEVTTLKLSRYIIQNKLKIPTNFCRFQLMPVNRRFSLFVINTYESLTSMGTIKRIEITNPTKEIINYLNKCDQSKWKMENTSVYLSPNLLDQISPIFKDIDKFFISYYVPKISNIITTKTAGKIIKVNTKFSIKINKQLFLKIEIKGADNISLYHSLFNEKKPIYQIIKKVLNKHHEKNGKLFPYADKLSRIMNFYYKFRDLEFVGTDLV